eukprot:1157661-Pelagomonas_calceolata.AAC.6
MALYYSIKTWLTKPAVVRVKGSQLSHHLTPAISRPSGSMWPNKAKQLATARMQKIATKHV